MVAHLLNFGINENRKECKLERKINAISIIEILIQKVISSLKYFFLLKICR